MIMEIPWTLLESVWNPPLHKQVTGQELFFAVSYSKPALVKCSIRVFKPIFEQRSAVSLVLAVRNERNYRSNYHLGQAHYHAKRSK